MKTAYLATEQALHQLLNLFSLLSYPFEGLFLDLQTYDIELRGLQSSLPFPTLKLKSQPRLTTGCGVKYYI